MLDFGADVDPGGGGLGIFLMICPDLDKDLEINL